MFQNFMLIKARKKYILLQYFFFHMLVSLSGDWKIFSVFCLPYKYSMFTESNCMKLLKETKLEHILLLLVICLLLKEKDRQKEEKTHNKLPPLPLELKYANLKGVFPSETTEIGTEISVITFYNLIFCYIN